MTARRTPVRDLAIGVGVSMSVIVLTFFGTFGVVDAATLAATIVVLIWVSTVDPTRLVHANGHPAPMLLGLGAVAIALLFTAATLISTVTEYISLGVGVAAYVIGLVRAIRFGWTISSGG